MNYYEELGISPQATEQEIRKAHRRLVKLMHPDAQPDPNMKIAAEGQMRRLNSIAGTLLDSTKRRQYNEQIEKQSLGDPHAPSSWRGIPWWLASAAGAIILTLVAIWLLADRMGSGYRSKGSETVLVPPLEDKGPLKPTGSGTETAGSAANNVQQPTINPRVKEAQDRKDVPVNVKSQPVSDATKSTSKAAPASTPIAVVAGNTNSTQPNNTAKREQSGYSPAVKSNPEQGKTQSASIIASNNRAADSAVSEPAHNKKSFQPPVGTLVSRVAKPRVVGSQLPTPPSTVSSGVHEAGTSALPGLSLTTVAPPPTLALTNSAKTRGPSDSLEGEWVYAPKEPERKRPGFYPPEFIDLRLFGNGDGGSLRGQYSAKYVVTGRPVSPDVNFELASAAPGSRTFLWQGNNGAKGTMSINPIDESTIRVDWHVTSAIRGPALTSGQATLVRRQ